MNQLVRVDLCPRCMGLVLRLPVKRAVECFCLSCSVNFSAAMHLYEVTRRKSKKHRKSR